MRYNSHTLNITHIRFYLFIHCLWVPASLQWCWGSSYKRKKREIYLFFIWEREREMSEHYLALACCDPSTGLNWKSLGCQAWKSGILPQWNPPSLKEFKFSFPIAMSCVLEPNISMFLLRRSFLWKIFMEISLCLSGKCVHVSGYGYFTSF